VSPATWRSSRHEQSNFARCHRCKSSATRSKTAGRSGIGFLDGRWQAQRDTAPNFLTSLYSPMDAAAWRGSASDFGNITSKYDACSARICIPTCLWTVTSRQACAPLGRCDGFVTPAERGKLDRIHRWPTAHWTFPASAGDGAPWRRNQRRNGPLQNTTVCAFIVRALGSFGNDLPPKARVS